MTTPLLHAYKDMLACRSERQRLILAEQIMEMYAHLSMPEKYSFFKHMHAEQLWGHKGLCLLQAPHGHTIQLIRMRQDMLSLITAYPELAPLDIPFKIFFRIVFNRCCLRFERILWDKTPNSVLNKIISYEAIHHIPSLNELKNRLICSDRLMYAYFHPLLGDEPLIFTEVALMQNTPQMVESILVSAENRKIFDSNSTNTAIFYSISKSHKGLTGVPFGNLLIKQVVQTIQSEIPHINTFVTLSPMPNFTHWTQAQMGDTAPILQVDELRTLRAVATCGDTHAAILKNAKIMKQIIAKYIMYTPQGRAINRVAHFHLGNGAEFYDIQIGADPSRMDESYGCMVNYRYNTHTIEDNIEAYFNDNKVAISEKIVNL